MRVLFLLFRLGKDRYALEAARIEQVLPLLEAKELPGAPPGVAGLISYHGAPVPLIDLTRLATGRAAAELMSTRIILIRYSGVPAQGGAAGAPAESRDGGRPEPDTGHHLALCAEQVIATVKRNPADFVPTGVDAGLPAHLGPVAADEDGLIQWIHADALLTDEIRAILFRAGDGTASRSAPEAAR